MNVGNIVKPTKESNYVLASGCSSYGFAVVISTSPFVITSKAGDMRWECSIKKEDFEIVGNVDEILLNICMRRLKY